MGSKSGTKTVYRNSITGRWVKPSYVKDHPRTTETEHRPVRSPKKGK
jgi:hypothetical protein